MVAPLLPGDPRELGPYWLEGRLGAGSQGDVYAGYDAVGNRYAIKAFRGAGERLRRALRDEVSAIQKVAPFCTARVVDADVTGPVPFVVSEYVAGGDLQDAIDRGGPFPPQNLHRLAVGVATALTAIHRAGVVHRDLKPGNVLLGPDGPRVIDFGIARTEEMSRTAVGGLKGTPAYIAPETYLAWLHPERFPDHSPTPAVDIWAWGAIVLFCATGHRPFGASSLEEAAHRTLHHEPDVSALEEPLRSLVSAALAKDPGDRPQAHELLLGLIGVSDPAAGQDRAGRALHATQDAPSLAETAESVFARLEPPVQAVVPRVLLRMVAAGENAQETLRSAGREEFTDGETDEGVLDEALRNFTEAGVLHQEDGRVSLSNAALLRAWPRLRAWVEDERDGLDVHQGLTDAARQWHAHGRKNSDLYQGTSLARALSWAAAHRLRLALNRVEREFLEAASTLSRRRGRTRTLVSAVLAVLLLVAVGTAVFAFDQRRTVVEQRDRAASAQVAGLAQSLRRTQPELARRLAVASSAIADTSESQSALLALRNQREGRAVKFPGFEVSRSDLDGTGRFLLAAGGTQVELWDVDEGRRLGSYDAGAKVTRVDLSDDGRTAAVNTGAARTVILDAPGLSPRDAHGYGSSADIKLSPSGTYLAVTLRVDGDYVPVVWNTRTGRKVFERSQSSSFEQWSFSPDERVASLTERDRITWFDLPSWKKRSVPDFRVKKNAIAGLVAFGPDGRSATVLHDRGVRHVPLTDQIHSGQDYTHASENPATEFDHVHYSHDGRYVAKNFTVWDTTRVDQEAHVMSYETVASECSLGTFRFSVDDSELRCVGDDGFFRSLKTPELAEEPDQDRVRYQSGTASGNGAVFALRTDHGKIEIWSAVPPARRFEIDLLVGEHDLVLSPDGRLLAAESDRREGIEIWDLAERKRLGVLPDSFTGAARPIAFSPDGKALVHHARLELTDRGGVNALRFWDLTTMKLIREVKADFGAETFEQRSVSFLPDGRSVVASPNFGLVAFPSGRVVTGGTPELRVDAVSADGSTLYVEPTTANGGISFLDPRTLQPKGDILRVGPVTGQLWITGRSLLAYSPDDRTIATVHQNETGQEIRLWDLRNRVQLGIPLTGPLMALAFSPDGSALVSVDGSGRFRSRTVAPSRLATELCTESGPLSHDEWKTYIPDIPYRATC